MASFKSPVSHQLHTNHVPDEVERTEITKFLLEPERRKADLKHEMVFLQRALDHFTEARTRLQNTINQHRALLSPSMTLPHDVLLTIFLFCLPESHNALMDPNEPPLVLGRVCRRWRFIAHNSPCLWTSLHIPFPTLPSYPFVPSKHVLAHFQARMSLHQAAIHQWLARSGLYPLSLSLHPPVLDRLDDIRSNDYRGHLILFISVFHRLRALEVTIPSGDFSAFFASITPEELPMLECIRLTFLVSRPQVYHYDNRTLHDEKWRHNGFLRVRNLREVDFTQFPFPIPAYTNIRWHYLTYLNITYSRVYWQGQGFTIREAHAVLIQCYNLVHLGIEVIDGPDSTCPFGLIRLPYLQSITLLDAAYHLETLIDRFDVPNLKNIQYQTKFCPSDLRRSPLLVLLSSNHWGTEKLTTNIEFLTLHELQWCFFYAPSLTHFRHERKRISTEQSIYLSTCRGLPLNFISAFLEFLIPDRRGKCSWPNLIYVHIKGVYPESIYDNLVKRLVEGRRRRGGERQGAPVLKQVRIESEGYNAEFTWEPYTRYTLNPLALEDGFKVEGGGGGGRLNVDFSYPPASRLPFPGTATGTFYRGYPGDPSCRWSQIPPLKENVDD